MFLAAYTQPNVTIGAVETLIKWRIGDRVLIPDLARDIHGVRFDGIDCRGKVCSPAGSIGHADELASSPVNFRFIIGGEQTDRFDRGIRYFCLSPNLVE